MVSFAAVGGNSRGGSGKQTDQHQRGAIKHRQQHFKKGRDGFRCGPRMAADIPTAKGARGVRHGGDQPMPSCVLPSGVSRSTVARPSKSTSKSSGAKSGGVPAVDKARQLALQMRRFRAARRGGDVHHVAVELAVMLVLHRVDHVAVPKYRVARLQIGNREIPLNKGDAIFPRSTARGPAPHRTNRRLRRRPAARSST